MKTVLYPGSFDPPTKGHLDLVVRARQLFDRVVVAVGDNPKKSTLFTAAERIEMLRHEFGRKDGIDIISFSGLAVTCARDEKCTAILRGLRDGTDFSYEYPMTLTNRELAPELETVFLMPSPEFAFLSSRLVKEVYQYGGEVDRFLTGNVVARLRRKFDAQ